MITGPLIGGAFTTSVTWRWCFYLNLPLGGVVLVVIFFLLDIPDRVDTPKSFTAKLRHLSVPGVLVLVPGVVCLCLALQWGGTVYPWSDARVIALLALFGALAVAFAVEQYFANIKSTATVPVTILRSPTILLVASYAFSTAAALNLYEYYVSTRFLLERWFANSSRYHFSTKRFKDSRLLGLVSATLAV